jgi:hypothetical protein
MEDLEAEYLNLSNDEISTKPQKNRTTQDARQSCHVQDFKV